MGYTCSGAEPIWLQQTLKVVMDVEYQRWFSRNEAMYPTGFNHSDSQIRQQCLMKIKDLYQYKDKVVAQDQHIFYVTVAQWKERPVSEMVKWIRTNSEHIRYCPQMAIKHTLIHSSDIRKYIDVTHTKVSDSTVKASHKPQKKMIQTQLTPVTANKLSTIQESEPDLQPNNKIQTQLSRY